jgi:hypothetical protein
MVMLLLPMVPAHTLPVIVPGQSVMLEKVLPVSAVAVQEYDAPLAKPVAGQFKPALVPVPVPVIVDVTE